MLYIVMQATIVMSDSYTYTKVLGSARQPLDIIYIPALFAFTSSSVSSWTSFISMLALACMLTQFVAGYCMFQIDVAEGIWSILSYWPNERLFECA